MNLDWSAPFCALMMISNLAAASDYLGKWVGGLTLNGNYSSLAVTFEAQSGNAEIISEGALDLPVQEVKAGNDALEFQIVQPNVTIQFSGKVENNLLQGTVSAQGLHGRFELVRLYPIQHDDLFKLFGVYRFDSGEQMFIRTWDELGRNQMTVFHSDGSIFALYPKTSTEFFSGSGLLTPLPARYEFQFVQQSGKPALRFKHNGKVLSAAKVDTIRELQFKIPNQQREIAATLTLPEKRGPNPAVVLVHGSGSVTRDFFGPFAYMLASRGIAVLTYDKRDDWLESSFESLADDAFAVFQWLRKQKEVDRERAGFLGISQGGWIVPAVASRTTETAFAVLISAAAVTPAEQEVMRLTGEMQAIGADPNEIETAVKELKSQLEWLLKEDSAAELEKEVAALREAGKYAELKKSGINNPQFLLWYREMQNFDPVPLLSNMKCPVLAIYGGLDRTVPVDPNLNLLRNALKNQSVAVKVFDAGNHALLESKTGSRSEFAHLTRFVPGFFDLVASWILKVRPRAGT